MTSGRSVTPATVLGDGRRGTLAAPRARSRYAAENCAENVGRRQHHSGLASAARISEGEATRRFEPALGDD